MEDHPVQRLIAATATTAVIAASAAEEAAIAAEAGEQQDPDDPFASAAVATEESAVAASAATVVVAASTVTATAEEQQDNPDPAPASIVVLGVCTSAGIIAATVCSSQITHFFCLQRFIYGLLYAGRHVNVSCGQMLFFGCVSFGKSLEIIPGYSKIKRDIQV